MWVMWMAEEEQEVRSRGKEACWPRYFGGGERSGTCGNFIIVLEGFIFELRLFGDGGAS